MTLSQVEARLARVVLGYDSAHGTDIQRQLHGRGIYNDVNMEKNTPLAEQIWKHSVNLITKQVMGWHTEGGYWVNKNGDSEIHIDDWNPISNQANTWVLVQTLKSLKLACITITNDMVRFFGHNAPKLLLCELLYDAGDTILSSIVAGIGIARANALEIKGRFFTAAANNNSSYLATLIAEGIDVNWYEEERGCTALYVAASMGNLACVRVLLDSGADPDMCDWKGCSPLHIAASKGLSNIVTEFRSHDVVVDFTVDYHCFPENSVATSCRKRSPRNDTSTLNSLSYDDKVDDLSMNSLSEEAMSVSMERFYELKSLLQCGWLTVDEFEHRKRVIVDNVTGTRNGTPQLPYSSQSTPSREYELWRYRDSGVTPNSPCSGHASSR